MCPKVPKVSKNVQKCPNEPKYNPKCPKYPKEPKSSKKYLDLGKKKFITIFAITCFFYRDTFGSILHS